MRLAVLMIAAAAVLPSRPGADPTQAAIGYICAAEQTPHAAGPRDLVMEPGMGNSRMAIAAAPQAQAWFDFGLSLADGFYHDDARTAFQKAQAADPDCAMCAWGEAWATGPNLNIPAGPPERAKALALTGKAEALAANSHAPQRDLALIAALRMRDSRPDGDIAYAQAMDEVARKYPAEDEVQVFAAHALMIPGRGADKARVERAIEILEAVLKRHPDNAAAIHFYIHATEFAGRAALALPYAQKLASLAPAASHMVHMPAHTLLRVGRYEDAALLNAEALDSEAQHRRIVHAPGPLGDAGYYTHNFTFGLAGALMAGDRTLALKYAAHAPAAYPASLPAGVRSPVIGKSYIALARFDPQAAMAIPEPPGDDASLTLMRHYARGEAQAGRGDAAAVQAEAQAIAAMPTPPAAPGRGGWAGAVKQVAQRVLEGRAAMLRKDPRAAAQAYARAADLQDEALRDAMDPPPWWYPVRRSLAAALLASGQYADAAAEAQRSLAEWPQDGVALKVLSQAEAKLGHAAEAQRRLAQARRSYRGNLDAVGLPLV